MPDIKDTKEYKDAVEHLAKTFETCFPPGQSGSALDHLCLTEIDRVLVNNVTAKILSQILSNISDMPQVKTEGLVLLLLGVILAQEGRIHVGAVN